MKSNNSRRNFIKNASIVSANIYLLPSLPATIAKEFFKDERNSVLTAYCLAGSIQSSHHSKWGEFPLSSKDQLILAYAHFGEMELKSVECNVITSPTYRFNFFPDHRPDAYHLIFNLLNPKGNDVAIHLMKGDARPKEAIPVLQQFDLHSGVIFKTSKGALFTSLSGDLICHLN